MFMDESCASVVGQYAGSRNKVQLEKGSSLFFWVSIIKSNMLNVKGLANEDKNVVVQINLKKNIIIYQYWTLFLLEPFSWSQYAAILL